MGISKFSDYYSLLKLPKTATISEIKNSYKEISEKWHKRNSAGKSASNPNYKDISKAYEVLSNAHTKRLYDEHLQFKKDGNFKIDRRPLINEFPDKDFENKIKELTSQDEFFRNNWNVFPSDMFKNFTSDFNDMFKFTEEMMKISERMFNMPALALDEEKPDIKHKEYYKKITSETTFIKGKRKTTIRVNENGRETVMTYEDDVMTSKVIDGVPQDIKQIK